MEQKTTTIKKMFFAAKAIKRFLAASSLERLQQIDVNNGEVKVISTLRSSVITRSYKEHEFFELLGVKGQMQEWTWHELTLLNLIPGLSVVTKIEETSRSPEKKV